MLRSVANAGDVCVRLALTRTGTMARVQLPRNARHVESQQAGLPDSDRLLPLSRALRAAVLAANRLGADVAVIPASEPPGDLMEPRQ
jgi:hypothetical protein